MKKLRTIDPSVKLEVVRMIKELPLQSAQSDASGRLETNLEA